MAEPRTNTLVTTNAPTLASVVILRPPQIGLYEFFGCYSRHLVSLPIEELTYARVGVVEELFLSVHRNQPSLIKHRHAVRNMECAVQFVCYHEDRYAEGALQEQ